MDTGKQETFKLLSGQEVTVRELNGNDDDVISRIGSNQDGTAVAKFLAGVIISPVVSWQKVQQWKSGDRYYLLLLIRIMNFGTEFVFKHKFEESGLEVDFTEDLSKYVVDVDNYKEDIEDRKDFPYLPVLYPHGSDTHRELTLGNKKVRYQYLNGESEAMAVAKNFVDIEKNDELRFRMLSVEAPSTKTGWKVIERFHEFSSSEMRAIRRDIKENEGKFDMAVEVINPKNAKEVEQKPLIQYPEFFFPE